MLKSFFFSTALIFGCGLFLSNVYAQQVDEFTGDFFYNIPLLSIPTPDGKGIAVTAQYKGGIQVDENASDLGLGWRIDADGAIARIVNNISDDWRGISAANQEKKDFKNHYGPLYFKDKMQFDANDFMDSYTSTYRLGNNRDDNNLSFQFPDYDTYYINGPGISGQIEPHLFDFGTMQSINFVNENVTFGGKFTKTAQFRFVNEHSSFIHSRHYPSPIDNTTNLQLPESMVDGSSEAFEGNGYNPTDNQMAGAKHIEYFTNAQIQAHKNGTVLIVGEFLDYKTGQTRTSDNCDLDGIGAFRITDEAGMVYHYSLPVYSGKVIEGHLPLNKDYSLKTVSSPTNLFNTSTGDYIIKDGDEVIELSKNAKYATTWKLIAVTGTDYVDANNNGLADEADKGYWISYEYALWTKDFRSSSPLFGYEKTFTSGEYDVPDFQDKDKKSGKEGQFTALENETYYLNKIQTPTHTALFVRDFRLDEYSHWEWQEKLMPTSVNIPVTGHLLTRALQGTVYDNGGTGNMILNADGTLTIAPVGADFVTLTFTTFNFFTQDNSRLEIYDGPDISSPLIVTYGSCNFCPTTVEQVIKDKFGNITGTVSICPECVDISYFSPIRSSGKALTLRLVTDPNSEFLNAVGFAAEWAAGWNAGVNPFIRPPVMPQLKLSKIVLLRNEDAAQLPLPGTMTTSNIYLDIFNTTADKGGMYNMEWYTANQSSIEPLSLKTVEFEQDYSLAKKYYNNVNTVIGATFNDKSQQEVQNSISTLDYSQSGKLTLNKIRVFEKEHVQTRPSTNFEYYKDESSANPDYNPLTQDYWGFYKSDISTKALSRYTTDVSKRYVGAWSLKKITDPNGAIIEVEYEADTYNKVLSEKGIPVGPTRIYSVSDATYGTVEGNWQITMEEDTRDFYDLLKTYANGGTNYLGVIPYYDYFNTKPLIGQGTYTYEVDDFQKKIVSVSGLTTYSGCGQESILLDPITYADYGYLAFPLPLGTNMYGGGTRVKSITTTNELCEHYIQRYTYVDGVAASEADRFALPTVRKLKFKFDDFSDPSKGIWVDPCHFIPRDIYLKLQAANNDKHRLAPLVGYSSVIVENMTEDGRTNGKIMHDFISSDEGIDNFEPEINESVSNSDASCGAIFPNSQIVIRVKDAFSSQIGNQKSEKIYDVNGNIVFYTLNEYNSTLQGSVEEVFHYSNGTTWNQSTILPPCTWTYDVACLKRSYPSILKKQTVYKNGHSSTIEYQNFDALTGAPTVIKTDDPTEGTAFIQSQPVYLIPGYEEMGSKAINQNNKNILLPIAKEEIIKDPAITSSHGGQSSSVKVNAWNKSATIRQFNIISGKFESMLTDNYWKPQANYNWVGSLTEHGLYSHPTTFNFSPGAFNSPIWRLNEEITLYDKRNNALEKRQFNNRFSCSKYGYNNERRIAEATNVNYVSFTYSGFEDKTRFTASLYFFDGEISHGEFQSSALINISPHTGKYMLLLPASQRADFITRYENISELEQMQLQRGRTYRASVWVHKNSPSEAKLVMELKGTITGGSVNISKDIRKDNVANILTGDWYLLNLDITVPEDYISSSSTDGLKISMSNAGTTDAYFDDLLIRPIDASVKCYVYDKRTGYLLANLDNNDFAILYEYDAEGRIIKTYREIEGKGFIKSEEKEYSNARPID